MSSTAAHSKTMPDSSGFQPHQNLSRQVMSSREIAALVGSRHDSVKRTIERLAERRTISVPPVVEYLDDLNRSATEYQICKRDSFVIVAQLSPEFTAALVDRWAELESRQMLALPDFSNPAAAARAWAEQFELQQAAAQELRLAAPKVAFVDQYVEAAGSMSFRQVAKLLSAKERQFRQMLLDMGVMYYLGGVLTPTAQHHAAKRFELKTGTSETNGHAFAQARFTAKGVQWIAGVWANYKLEKGL
ncbi:phage antirepressor KilAC domain-containing protein [Pseudomonas sp. NPDC090202]|uniref:phage antirepressor KilAC domain-containing protein n=1 Tax=Pseudomonas sp. NPDC090202 TaxID=3364476 RepID=UPI0037F1760A